LASRRLGMNANVISSVCYEIALYTLTEAHDDKFSMRVYTSIDQRRLYIKAHLDIPTIS